MTDYTTLIEQNQERWDSAEYKPGMEATAERVAERLCTDFAKERYQSVSDETGVPWWVIAVIHEREASQNWRANIAQGDRWDRKSVNVPRGRGPFASWHDAAIDALTNCAPYAAKWQDWSAGGALTLLELYNGLGYERKGIASPYLWSGTQHYTRGKYVADGKFSASTVDSQLGCAVLIHEMQKLCPDILSAPAGIMNDDRQNIDPSEFPKAANPATHISDIADQIPVVANAMKPIVRSKIAVGAAGLGTASAANTISSDPQLHGTIFRLIQQPSFWMALLAIALAGYIIYCRWKDHGGGALR